jgi:AcrR family transcriptional regulator
MVKYDKKKGEIIEAGIKAFAAYGYYKTTLEDIAQMLGMKKNSLYYYFKNKEDLFREIIMSDVDEHFASQERILAKNISNAKKIEEILLDVMRFIRTRTSKYSVKLSTYLEFSAVVKREFSEFNTRQCKIIETLIKNGIKSGEFRKVNAKQVSKDMGELVPALVNNAYLNSDAVFVHDVEFEEIVKRVRRVVRYVINGMKNK